MSEQTPAERHREVAGHFTDLVNGVTDWDVPTPVAEWTARGVVDHLAEWLPGFITAGSSVELPHLPTEAGDPAIVWAGLRDAVQELLEDPARADSMYTSDVLGTMPLGRVIDQFYTSDIFMHSWDLARATGQVDTLDEATCVAMHHGMAAMGPALRDSGQFGTEQPVAPSATPQERFIAFIGRDPYWQPPAAKA